MTTRTRRRHRPQRKTIVGHEFLVVGLLLSGTAEKTLAAVKVTVVAVAVGWVTLCRELTKSVSKPGLHNERTFVDTLQFHCVEGLSSRFKINMQISHGNTKVLLDSNLTSLRRVPKIEATAHQLFNFVKGNTTKNKQATPVGRTCAEIYVINISTFSSAEFATTVVCALRMSSSSSQHVSGGATLTSRSRAHWGQYSLPGDVPSAAPSLRKTDATSSSSAVKRQAASSTTVKKPAQRLLGSSSLSKTTGASTAPSTASTKGKSSYTKPATSTGSACKTTTVPRVSRTPVKAVGTSTSSVHTATPMPPRVTGAKIAPPEQTQPRTSMQQQQREEKVLPQPMFLLKKKSQSQVSSHEECEDDKVAIPKQMQPSLEEANTIDPHLHGEEEIPPEILAPALLMQPDPQVVQSNEYEGIIKSPDSQHAVPPSPKRHRSSLSSPAKHPLPLPQQTADPSVTPTRNQIPAETPFQSPTLQTAVSTKHIATPHPPNPVESDLHLSQRRKGIISTHLLPPSYKRPSEPLSAKPNGSVFNQPSVTAPKTDTIKRALDEEFEQESTSIQAFTPMPAHSTKKSPSSVKTTTPTAKSLIQPVQSPTFCVAPLVPSIPPLVPISTSKQAQSVFKSPSVTSSPHLTPALPLLITPPPIPVTTAPTPSKSVFSQIPPTSVVVESIAPNSSAIDPSKKLKRNVTFEVNSLPPPTPVPGSIESRRKLTKVRAPTPFRQPTKKYTGQETTSREPSSRRGSISREICIGDEISDSTDNEDSDMEGQELKEENEDDVEHNEEQEQEPEQEVELDQDQYQEEGQNQEQEEEQEEEQQEEHEEEQELEPVPDQEQPEEQEEEPEQEAEEDGEDVPEPEPEREQEQEQEQELEEDQDQDQEPAEDVPEGEKEREEEEEEEEENVEGPELAEVNAEEEKRELEEQYPGEQEQTDENQPAEENDLVQPSSESVDEVHLAEEEEEAVPSELVHEEEEPEPEQEPLNVSDDETGKNMAKNAGDNDKDVTNDAEEVNGNSHEEEDTETVPEKEVQNENDETRKPTDFQNRSCKANLLDESTSPPRRLSVQQTPTRLGQKVHTPRTLPRITDGTSEVSDDILSVTKKLFPAVLPAEPSSFSKTRKTLPAETHPLWRSGTSQRKSQSSKRKTSADFEAYSPPQSPILSYTHLDNQPAPSTPPLKPARLSNSTPRNSATKHCSPTKTPPQPRVSESRVPPIEVEYCKVHPVDTPDSSPRESPTPKSASKKKKTSAKKSAAKSEEICEPSAELEDSSAVDEDGTMEDINEDSSEAIVKDNIREDETDQPRSAECEEENKGGKEESDQVASSEEDSGVPKKVPSTSSPVIKRKSVKSKAAQKSPGKKSKSDKERKSESKVKAAKAKARAHTESSDSESPESSDSETPSARTKTKPKSDQEPKRDLKHKKAKAHVDESSEEEVRKEKKRHPKTTEKSKGKDLKKDSKKARGKAGKKKAAIPSSSSSSEDDTPVPRKRKQPLFYSSDSSSESDSESTSSESDSEVVPRVPITVTQQRYLSRTTGKPVSAVSRLQDSTSKPPPSPTRHLARPMQTPAITKSKTTRVPSTGTTHRAPPPSPLTPETPKTKKATTKSATKKAVPATAPKKTASSSTSAATAKKAVPATSSKAEPTKKPSSTKSKSKSKSKSATKSKTKAKPKAKPATRRRNTSTSSDSDSDSSSPSSSSGSE
ncbi:hypothetical protein Pelo_14771 [Pelomyxa schiedti]|nr:hypothetical protein Pelo_14771 [Pelomyxa schiedti]